jgi:hypothetical protein
MRLAHRGDYRGATSSAELLSDLFAERRRCQTADDRYLWEEQVSYFLAARSFTRADFDRACEREGLPLDATQRWATA